MPNWCCATVELSATEREIKRLKQAIQAGNKPKAEKGLLNALVPQPKFDDDQSWYDWNVSNWGTKWEIGSVTVNAETKTSLELAFDTAWGPATTAFETWADGGAGEFTFTYKYYEPGMGFLGEMTHDGTCSFEEYVSASDDPEQYREIARDVWGDEPWEEDEEEDEKDEEDEEDDSDDIVKQAPYHPGYEDVAVIDDAGMSETYQVPHGTGGSDPIDFPAQPDFNEELAAALAQLKQDFDRLIASRDPVYEYLLADIKRLTDRIRAYGETNRE